MKSDNKIVTSKFNNIRKQISIFIQKSPYATAFIIPILLYGIIYLGLELTLNNQSLSTKPIQLVKNLFQKFPSGRSVTPIKPKFTATIVIPKKIININELVKLYAEFLENKPKLEKKLYNIFQTAVSRVVWIDPIILIKKQLDNIETQLKNGVEDYSHEIAIPEKELSQRISLFNKLIDEYQEIILKITNWADDGAVLLTMEPAKSNNS